MTYEYQRLLAQSQHSYYARMSSNFNSPVVKSGIIKPVNTDVISLGILGKTGTDGVWVNGGGQMVLCASNRVGLDFDLPKGVQAQFWLVRSSTSPFEIGRKVATYEGGPIYHWTWHGVKPMMDSGFYPAMAKIIERQGLVGRFEFQWREIEVPE